MKYEYGVEYETNGNEPCLADDIIVEQYSTADKKWHKGAVGGWNWRARTITKFRIVDERYKPKPKDNTWFERGELPPVGAVCEYDSQLDWEICKVVAINGKAIAFTCDGDKDRIFVTNAEKTDFRPLKTEREKAIEAAKELIKSFDIPPAVYGALYDAGLLRLPEEK